MEAKPIEVQTKIKQQETWQKSIDLAQGIVKKDDLKLLKKTVKRKEQEKKKSAVSWNEREKTLKWEQESKQKKREANLAQRKDQKKVSKKTKKRAGFEGKGFKPKNKRS